MPLHTMISALAFPESRGPIEFLPGDRLGLAEHTLSIFFSNDPYITPIKSLHDTYTSSYPPCGWQLHAGSVILIEILGLKIIILIVMGIVIVITILIVIITTIIVVGSCFCSCTSLQASGQQPHHLQSHDRMSIYIYTHIISDYIFYTIIIIIYIYM